MGIIGVGILGILCVVLPIVVIVMIIVAIIKRNKDGKEVETFENVVRTIYIYVMLIAFLCTAIGGVLYLADSAIDYFIPTEEFTNSLNDVNKKNEVIVNIYTAASMVVISVPLFIYHSKLAKKLKEA